MTPDRSTLRESLSVLRRRKWTALLAVVAVPAAVVGLSMLQEPMYSASAQVLLSHQNLANSLNNVLDPSLSLDPQRLSQTQVNIAETPQVAAGVLRAARLHDRTPQQFLASAIVSARTDSDLLVFSVTDRSSKLAPKLATLFASQYLSYADQL